MLVHVVRVANHVTLATIATVVRVHAKPVVRFAFLVVRVPAKDHVRTGVKIGARVVVKVVVRTARVDAKSDTRAVVVTITSGESHVVAASHVM